MEWQTPQNGLVGGTIPTGTTSYTSGYTGGSNAGITQLTPYSQSGLSYPNGGWIPEDNSYQAGSLLGASSTRQTSPAPIDPYAQYGGKAAYDSNMSQFNMGKQNIDTSSNEAIGDRLTSGRSDILGYIDQVTNAQKGLDTRRQNAQFSQLQGGRDIQEMVGRGIRSGGVMLANKNAASSSAAGQIARAYGDLGNREIKDVNNQFALENQGIQTDQEALATGFETKKRDLDTFKQTNSSQIATQARQDLAALEQMRIGASLPEQFKIDQEVQRIKDTAMSRLGELDGLLQTEYSKIQPMGAPDVRAKAYQMQEAGGGGPQMFNFDTNAQPLQVSGGVAGAELPIYSNLQLNKRRQN